MSTEIKSSKDFLHQRFNPRGDNIPPVRLKGFNRDHLAQLFAELGFKKGLEIGVADGQNSLRLCQNIPDLELWLIDPWESYDRNPRGRKHQDHNWELAHERLEPYNVHFLRGKSMERIHDIPDRSLDFVYIDGHHGFDFVMQDLIEARWKVRKGGIIAGHDYYRFKWAGVVDAVDAYTKAHMINEWFIDDCRETTFFWSNEWSKWERM